MIEIIDGTIKLSVRNLVEFLCRQGDIDNRFGGISDKNAMEAGSRAHKKIQHSMGPDYSAEVPLRTELQKENYNIVIEGRADGIFTNQDGVVTIDEIKGTYADVRRFTQAVYVHKAQAMCYALFYSVDKNLDRIGIRMTYVNLDTEDTRYFEELMTRVQLEQWFDGLIEELVRWGDYVYIHNQERNLSIKGLDFPFDYRDGQRELAVSVYKAVNRKKNLFIQAPTGVGKTISTVYPSVKAIGEGIADKIFYLTAKTITRTAAEEAFAVLRRDGLKFKTVTITAKDKICALESDSGPECNPTVCPYAKGHFDRVNDAVYDLINNEDVITRQVIEEYARRHNVCPFEFCLDVTYWMDGIICDYNYVFDPHVFLKRFFAEGKERNYIFLVDEAHNLVDRAREMYSAQVYKEEFLSVKKLVAGVSKRLASALDRCNRNLLTYKHECDSEYKIIPSEDMFALNMQRLGEEITKFMEQNRDFQFMKELSDFFFKVMHYNDMHEALDENYVIYTEHTDNGFMLRLYCVNPSVNLKSRLACGRCGIFFSATLLPINYYKDLLSGDREDYAIYAHSPFDVNNRLLIVGRDVTSRYTRRNRSEFMKIRSYINNIASARPGNYIVFFPSYKYMNDVYQCCIDNNDDVNIEYAVQYSGMTEEDKEQFLEKFANTGGNRTLIGMCVMGGIFSEGIDLKNEQLIGSIIVGTGLPSLCTSQQVLRQYFDDRENCGYEYAYIYPGMNKVLQAAGRVIRTDDDKGVIALLDDRFLSVQYQTLFPVEWSNYRVTTVENAQEEILDFWNDMLYNVAENVIR